MLKRLIREPLLHFLALGGALFLGSSLVSGEAPAREDAILVSAGKIEQLASVFARTWQRPPTPEELDGLINEWVREEAAAREAVRIGLDRDDTVIRRRLRQKFEFLAEDAVALAPPTEADLLAHFEANADDFRVDPRLSFRQVFLGATPGEARSDATTDLLTLLRGDPTADASVLGEPTLLAHAHADLSAREIASLFGPRFASSVMDLAPGAWSGPIESGYGRHLVVVDHREGGRLPDLNEVRERVQRDWEAARREAALDALYDELVGRYEVVVERPDDVAGGTP